MLINFIKKSFSLALVHRSRALGLMIFALLISYPTAAGAQFSMPMPGEDQHIVSKIATGGTASVKHSPGDTVAFLMVKGAPPRFVEDLRQQTGVFLESVERGELVNGELTVRLSLTTHMVNLGLSILASPTAVSLRIQPIKRLPVPKPEEVIGRLTQMMPMPGMPFLVPRRPSEVPCQEFPNAKSYLMKSASQLLFDAYEFDEVYGVIPEGVCKQFLDGVRAEAAVRANSALGSVERWAFALSEEDPWEEYDLAYRWTVLIGALVLMERKLFPEAENLLKVARESDVPWAPEIRFSLARLYTNNDMYDLASTELLPLLDPEEGGKWVREAYLAFVVSAIRRGNSSVAVQTAKQALEQLQPEKLEDPWLWVVGGEGALSDGDHKLASRFYDRIIANSGGWGRAFASMRRGDLIIRYSKENERDRYRMALDQYDKARDLVGNDAWLYQTIELREGIIRAQKWTRQEYGQMVQDILSDALAPTVETEAKYILARLRLGRGESVEAVKLIESLMADDSPVKDTKEIGELIVEAGEAMLKRLTRHESWLEIAETYERFLEKSPAGQSSLVVQLYAGALYHLGLHQRSISFLLRSLGESPLDGGKAEVSLALARAYFGLQDHFRAELVARYFVSRYASSPLVWRVRLLWAQALLDTGNPVGCMKQLELAKSVIPTGDPENIASLLRAAAYTRVGKINDAAKIYGNVVQRDGLDSIELERAGHELLQICVRKCGRKTLQKLLNSVAKYEQGKLINQRVAFFATLRGAKVPPGNWQAKGVQEEAAGSSSVTGQSGNEDGTKASNIWDELLEIAPELPPIEPKKTSGRGSR